MRLPHSIQKATDCLLTELRNVVNALAGIRSDIQGQTKAIHETRERDEQEKEPESKVRLIEVRPTDEIAREIRSDQDRGHRLQKSIKNATWCAFTAAAIYAAVASLQWCEMKKSTKIAAMAADAAQKGAAASASQAEATKQSIEATVANFQLDQRSWVGVVSANPFRLEPQPSFGIVLVVTNHGKTPALKFSSETVLHSLDKAQNFVADYGKAVDRRSIGAIQPQESINLRSNTYPLTEAQVEWVKSGKYILYVYGRMQYEDVFHLVHHTTFCKEVVSDNLLRDCGTYNTAD